MYVVGFLFLAQILLCLIEWNFLDSPVSILKSSEKKCMIDPNQRKMLISKLRWLCIPFCWIVLGRTIRQKVFSCTVNSWRRPAKWRESEHVCLWYYNIYTLVLQLGVASTHGSRMFTSEIQKNRLSSEIQNSQYMKKAHQINF